MSGRHVRGRWRRLVLVEWLVLAIIAGVLLIIALCVMAALRDPPIAPTRWRTVTVPGPTVTQSFLILRTVTPGVNGF